MRKATKAIMIIPPTPMPTPTPIWEDCRSEELVEAETGLLAVVEVMPSV